LEVLQRSREEPDRPYAQAFGRINAADAPTFHREAMREGACRLLTFEAAFCEPFCNGVCVDENVCEPFPTWVSAGDVVVTGLKAPLRLEADQTLGFYNPTSFPIPEDLFDAGDPISATAEGDVVPAFTLAAQGVAPLESEVGPDLVMVDGQDLEVTWTPAGGGDRIRLTLNSPNQGHGLPYRGIIECEGDDTGSLIVPRALIDTFPASFGAGICVSIDCPPSQLVRYRAGRVDPDGAGDIELVVGSAILFGALHEP
jgi:hypothetical protein